MAKTKVTSIMINTGYAESSSLSAFQACHAVGFSNAHDALADFCACLRDFLGGGNARSPMACCANAKGKYCCECGRSIKQGEAVSMSDIADYLMELNHSDIDGTADVSDFLSDRRWTIGETSDGIIACFDYTDSFVRGNLSAELCAVSLYNMKRVQGDYELPRSLTLPEKPAIGAEDDG